jgi:hypothetical protein
LNHYQKHAAVILLALAAMTEAGRASSAIIMIESSARQFGVPVALALKVARMETGARCGVWGDHGRSGGPLQIYYPTAQRMFGVHSMKSFHHLSCATLLSYGMRHLKASYVAAHGSWWLAALKHNGGIGAGSHNRKARAYANSVMAGHYNPKRYLAGAHRKHHHKHHHRGIFG